MKARNLRQEATSQRPLWVVGAVLVAGMVAVALVIALASHVYAYEIILYSFCIGIAGGIFAALLTDRLSVSSTSAILLVGAGFGLTIYGLYWFFLYRLAYWGAVDMPPFLEHARLLAEGSAIGRRGRVLFAIGPWGAMAIWIAEILVVVLSASAIARKAHSAFARL